jgi:hypothetical protein
MFMTQSALDDFMKSKGWSIGADMGGVARVNSGAGGDYHGEALKQAILGFVFARRG